MKRLVPLFSAVLLTLAGTSLADTVDTVNLTWNSQLSTDYTATVYANAGGGSGGANYLITGNGNPAYNWTEDVYVPPYSVTISDAMGAYTNSTQYVYCVDLVSGVGNDGNYNLVQMGSAPVNLTLGVKGGGTGTYQLSGYRLNAVEYLLANNYTNGGGLQASALSLALWQTIYSPTNGNGNGPTGNLPVDSINTNINAAGFAVGSVLDTSGVNVTSAVISTGTPPYTANDMLEAAYKAVEQSNFATPSGVYLLQDTADQDFTFAVLGAESEGAGVPEPVGLVSLAGMCLIGLPIMAFTYRRRRV